MRLGSGDHVVWCGALDAREKAAQYGVKVIVAEEVKTERDVIVFYPDGTADRREIVLRDSESAELVLRINPVTGRVRIAESE